MKKTNQYKNMDTLVSHYAEFENAEHAHVMPIYQTSTFHFEDTLSGAAIAADPQKGYFYTRINNPNLQQLARKLAALEAWDLVQNNPASDPQELAAGLVFASGMAAITCAVLTCVHAGETLITQRALYDGTFTLFNDLAPKYGLNIVWVDGSSLADWQEAFAANPKARLAYIETPVNPALSLTDIKAISSLAHTYGALTVVDNTFATPYCQRPLSLGADLVVHSTTKYLSGHGQVIGGALIGRNPDFVHGPLQKSFKIFGATPSPFDAWLANNGLKTFPMRMQRHCSNAMVVAQFLEKHPKVEKVFFPGLTSHSQHNLAKKQMLDFGAMLAFELKGGLEAGERMMNRVRLATLAVSLGNVDTLIQHPASMTHRNTPRDLRLASGITDGLVRLSVGIENVQDILEDLDQAMR